jgi:site-specific DNA-methyltransferase (adenine-specific)
MSKYEDILIFSKSPMGHKKQLGSKRMKYNPQGLIKINKQRKASPNQFGTTAGKRPSHKKEFTQEYTNYPNDLLVGFFEEISNIKLHPTQKPVALLEYLIKTYTNENELVLDNCIGSGSTAIACINTNRNYIGFEKEKEYCEIANNRIKNQKFF